MCCQSTIAPSTSLEPIFGQSLAQFVHRCLLRLDYRRQPHRSYRICHNLVQLFLCPGSAEACVPRVVQVSSRSAGPHLLKQVVVADMGCSGLKVPLRWSIRSGHESAKNGNAPLASYTPRRWQWPDESCRNFLRSPVSKKPACPGYRCEIPGSLPGPHQRLSASLGTRVRSSHRRRKVLEGHTALQHVLRDGTDSTEPAREVCALPSLKYPWRIRSAVSMRVRSPSSSRSRGPRTVMMVGSDSLNLMADYLE